MSIWDVYTVTCTDCGGSGLKDDSKGDTTGNGCITCSGHGHLQMKLKR